MNADMASVQRGIRYAQYMETLKQAFEKRSDTLESMDHGRMAKLLPPELHTIIYEKLAECTREGHANKVVEVGSERELDGLCHSLISPARRQYPKLEAVLKEIMLKQAPFRLEFVTFPDPLGKMPTRLGMGESEHNLGRKIRHLDITLHIVPRVSFRGHCHPVPLFAFRDGIAGAIPFHFPNLRSFDLTIDDADVNLYSLQTRSLDGIMDPVDYSWELIGLIRNIAQMDVEKKHYRFAPLDAALLEKMKMGRRMRVGSLLGLRRAFICEDEGKWINVTKDHLQPEELLGRLERLRRMFSEERSGQDKGRVTDA